MRMKTKKIMTFILVLLLFLQSPVCAFAGIQTGGFATGSLTYRIEYDSSFASASTIKGYVQRWNGISSKVALSYTTSTANNQISVNYMKIVSPNDNTLGITHYYYNGAAVNNSSTRNGAVCYIYKTSHTTPNTSSAKAAAYATCVHEVGHALSLTHSSNTSDVMYNANHSVTSPTNNDKAFLTTKWGN